MLKLLLRYYRPSNSLSHDHLLYPAKCRRVSLHTSAFSTDVGGETKPEGPRVSADGGVAGGYNDDKYPSGEFVYQQRSEWDNFLVKTRLFCALPWERIEKGSVLKMTLRGEVVATFVVYDVNLLIVMWICYLSFEG